MRGLVASGAQLVTRTIEFTLSMPSERQSLEEALDRLEQITRSLEGGEIELDNALALYEEGIRLLRLAEGVIREAEVRIEKLHEDGSTSRISAGERQG